MGKRSIRQSPWILLLGISRGLCLWRGPDGFFFGWEVVMLEVERV